MTRNQKITRDWIQITNGSEETTVQFYVPVDICDSDEKPGNDAPSLRFDNTTSKGMDQDGTIAVIL